MFSYTQKQLEIIINDNTINKEEINQILKNVIEKVEERKTKINTYNNKRYKEQTKDNEPKIRKRPTQYKKKPQEEKKTNDMKEYNKLYYELNKEKIKQQLKENRTNNKDKYNEYQKQYYNKKKSITSD